EAVGLHSESDLLLLNGTVFKSEVLLAGAKVDGNVEFTGTAFEDTLNANQLQVGGSLFMNSDAKNKASFKDVYLTDAKVARQLTMFAADIHGPLNADLLKVGGNLLAPSVGQYKTTFRSVSLINAEIGGNAGGNEGVPAAPLPVYCRRSQSSNRPTGAPGQAGTMIVQFTD